MNLSQLKPAKNSKKKRKIVGRGNASNGSFSGRGMNGQKARSGGSLRPGFEGGQMPIHRRLPKRGFNNFHFRTEYLIVNVSDINKMTGDNIDIEILRKSGFEPKKNIEKIKLLGNGTIDRAVKVQVHKASQSAIKKIEAAGGTVEVLD
jgi:large subunit ribosomal protein L15